MMKEDKQSGFAMLFTVLIVSLILSIALGISDITFKQQILSGLAKDSQIAFYQADTAMECGLHEDVGTAGVSNFPYPSEPSGVPSEFNCGDTRMVQQSESSTNYFVYKVDASAPANKPCFSIVFDKTTIDPVSSAVINIIDTRGYNICSPAPRQVERALRVRY